VERFIIKKGKQSMNQYIAHGDPQQTRRPVSHHQVFWIELEAEDCEKSESIEKLKEKQRQQELEKERERQLQQQRREQQKQTTN
jgi:hypothetical protein